MIQNTIPKVKQLTLLSDLSEHCTYTSLSGGLSRSNRGFLDEFTHLSSCLVSTHRFKVNTSYKKYYATLSTFYTM